MNPVLILTHNCIELTKKCVESVQFQTLPVEILAWDNGSTDGTEDWLPLNDNTTNFYSVRSQTNRGVSAGWNWSLDYYFYDRKADHVLVLNNDTIIPPWFYRTLLSYEGPFITGISVNSVAEIETPPERKELGTGPDFSGFLIRREAWEKVGPFDERMKHYASDCDWHVRAHRAGVPLMNAGVPFYHERSSTLKWAPPEERAEIQRQADADRAVFESIYGCMPGDKWYAELFK